MAKTVLSHLLSSEKQARRLSLRQIAKEVGVAHSTLVGLIGGRNSDLTTAIAVCEWLGVSLSVLAPHLEAEETKLDLLPLLRSVPGLSDKLVELSNFYTSGMISRSELLDLFEFIDLFMSRSIRKGKTRNEI